MSQALRKLTAATARANATVVFINQLRMKIGVMFGSPETTTGGNALKFYSSIRLDIRKTGVLKDGETVVGTKTRVKVVKNKVAPPFREAQFDIIYGTGVDLAGELIDIGSTVGVVDKAGAFYSWKGERLGQGRDKARDSLVAHPEIMAAVREAILGLPTEARLGPVAISPAKAGDAMALA
jgi:recombination protein RecA